MANASLSGLPTAGGVAPTDLLHIVTGAPGNRVDQSIPASTLALFIASMGPSNPGGGGAMTRSDLYNLLTELFATLPTDLPSTPGRMWLNGGYLAFS